MSDKLTKAERRLIDSLRRGLRITETFRCFHIHDFSRPPFRTYVGLVSKRIVHGLKERGLIYIGVKPGEATTRYLVREEAVK